MPSNASLRLRRRFQEELGTREEAQQRFRATIGDGAGNIEIPGKRNFVYIRREGRSRIEECHNTKAPRRYGLHVIVGYDPTNPDTLQILEPDWGGMASPDNYPYVPYHHESHEFQNADGGDDVTWIQSQQIVPLLVYPTDPTSMFVNVYGGWYTWDDAWHYFEATTSADLTGSIPGIVGNARYVLVAIDGATEVLVYTNGVEFPTALPPADIEDMIPVVSDGTVPVAAICLFNGMTAIGWDEIYDVRLMYSTTGASGIGAASNKLSFVTAVAEASLTSERVLSAGIDTHVTDGGAGTTIKVSRSGNVILLFNYAGAFVAEYPCTHAGFVAALAAAGAGDTVQIPPRRLTLDAAVTIPADVRVVGTYEPEHGQPTDITGATLGANFITLGLRAMLEDVVVSYGTAATNANAVVASGAYAIVRNCCVDAWTDTPSTAIGIVLSGDHAVAEHCRVSLSGYNNETCIGIQITHASAEARECIVHSTLVMGAGIHIGIQATAGHAWNCYGYGTTYGLQVTGAGTANARFGFYSGITADLRVEAGATLNVYCVQYNTTSLVGTLAYLPGDRVSPAGIIHAVLSATHSDAVPAAPIQGDLIVANATPAWQCHPRGLIHQIMKMNVAATDPIWAAFDWDDIAAAAGADMAHDHSVAGEGGEVPLASLGSYAQGRIVKGGGADWDTLAHPGVVQRLLETTAAEVQWVATDDGNAVNTVVRTDANAAIIPNRLGVFVPAPNVDGVIAQAEAGADPAGGGAGTARIYPKAVGTQTKYFFMDDAAGIYEIAGIAENVTKTVGGGGDFATIQAAIDWFKGWVIKGACVIDCDAGAYDEAVEFAGLLIAPGSTLTLEGDTRALAGLSYIDGAACNPAALANGGSGACGISNLGAVITVTGAGSNPDFDADGWGAGDRLMVYVNAHAIAIYDIQSTLNNTITLTVAAPAIGDDGTAIALVPNRSIDRSAAGVCISVVGVKGIVLDGWYLETAAGADCDGLRVTYGGSCDAYNILAYAEDYGLISNANYSSLTAKYGATSAWGGYAGITAVNAAQAVVTYAMCVGGTNGFYSSNSAYLFCAPAATGHCTTGYYCGRLSFITTSSSYARVGTRGYQAAERGYIYAATTNANNTAATPYTPTPTDTWGATLGSITFS